MATGENITRYLDLSGGLQTKTSRLLMKDNELARAENARYSKKLGGVTRRPGYETVGGVLSSSAVRGLASYFTKDGNYRLIANAGTDVYYENGNNWTSTYSSLPNDCKVDYESFLDYLFIVGYSESTDTYLTPVTQKGVSAPTTTNCYAAPRGKYTAKYNDKMYIANCWVNGKKYPNRIYVSSAPTDTITYVNGDQKGSVWQISVDSTRYLKAGMKVDIYGENSNVKKVDSLEIVSVDKSNERITFAKTTVDILDRDEIYLEDSKGNLGIFWNTDYPNAEMSDFIELPTENNESPEITSIFVHNNRLWIFTEHSRWKWDGANLVKSSSTIGTTSHWSVKEVRNWLVFANKSGLWAVSDANGMEQLVSRGIQEYIDAVSHRGWYNAVAMAKGDLYKLYVGAIDELGERTTSTSTSSTSTSSTSSSTSSTSTSSTSTSSTSSSTSATTYSTSSTSRSTSSTSVSTSSTSISTSSTSTSVSTSSTSTSTSTTTLTAGTEMTVLVYDFSIDAWSIDKVDRTITASVNHIMHGYEKIYFGDSSGRIYRDETGLTDGLRPVQLLVETKRFNQNLPEETKQYRYAYIYTQNGQGAVVSYSIDGNEWKVVGQLDKNVTRVDIGDAKGRDIAFRVTQNNGGEAVVFIGVSVVWLKGEIYGRSS